MNLEALFAEALGIKHPWKIKSVNFDSILHKLDINVDFERGAKFEYEDAETGEKGSYTAYDTVDKTWRHLNFFEHRCYIHTRTPRIKPIFGGIKLVMPPWSGIVAGFTLLFEALAIQICKNMPLNQASKILEVSGHRLWHLLDCYVFRGLMGADYSNVTAVGLDETSIAKGHDYITMFVNMNSKNTIFVTEGKDNITVKKFAENLEETKGRRNNIKDVSCDMSPAFTKGVTEQLPEAKITFDKFHILKIINEAVDEVRREEIKTNHILKGARYALLKNEENLTRSQKIKRESLSKMNLKSIKALNIRESFQMIYKAENENDFVILLKQWYYWATHSKIRPIIKAAKTIKAHWDGIVAWKKSSITNGISEGLNSIVQAAKRKARGYKFKHFKTICYMLTGGLNFKKINPYLPT